MKATELMIGDWVKDVIDGNIILAGELGSNEILCNDGLYRCYDELEPIPLTVKILEKNANGGFCYYDDKSRAIYHLHKGKEDVSIYVEWGRVYPEPYIELHGLGDTFFKGYCDSVSKLQHALRLCGLNELADNFRV